MPYRAAFEEPNGSRCVVLEDDDGAAWASLVVDGTVVSAVWLYNGAAEGGLPLNTATCVAEEPVVPQLGRTSEVEIAWDDAGATLYIDGVESARLEPGRQPAWSRQAAADGPLALVLRGDDGRPKPLSRLEYLVLVERLAKQVVTQVNAEGRVALFGESAALNPVDGSIAALARSLRYAHFPGDGCCDESGDAGTLPYLQSEGLIRRAHSHFGTRDNSDDEPYWPVIHELRKRGTRAEFELARSLVLNGEANETVIGCDVLAQLGTKIRWPDGAWPFREESVPLLLPLLDDERSELRAAATCALGHLGVDGFAERVHALVDDPSDDVRFHLARALCGRDDDPSLRVLVRLSADEYDDVRDWATFGLGSQTERDEPWIRDALFARVDDPYVEAAVEGVLGLAVRHDPRGVPVVRAWLEAGAEYTGMLDAAAEYAEPSWLPLLERLRGDSADADRYWVSCLESAITKCSAPR